MTKYRTNSDVFNIVHIGMYDSPLAPDSMFSYEFEDCDDDERRYTDDDWDRFDTDKYKSFVAHVATAVAEEVAKEHLLNAKYGIAGVSSNETVDSPSPYEGYNFRSDYLNIDIEMDDGWKATAFANLMKWSAENGKVEKYVHDHFTSYDGFTSFVPNNCRDIAIKIKNDDDIDRMAGLYARLCLVDAGYFDESEWSGNSEAETAYWDIVERVGGNCGFGDFLVDAA